ncbi:unnamed protein product, partial [Sphagnum jensenii]
CRAFTPVLAEFYNDLIESDNQSIEIIFISSDHDQSSFDEYWDSMPWTAVDFSNRNVKQ